MKNFLYILFLSCFMGAAIADVDFSQAIQSTSMPTDAEIRATISQFNFTKEQQEAIFKDTKKKLQMMYSGKNSAQINAELNSYLNQINDGSMDKVMDPSMKQELLRDVSTLPKTTNSSTSKTVVKEAETTKGFQSKGFQSKEPFSVKRN